MWVRGRVLDQKTAHIFDVIFHWLLHDILHCYFVHGVYVCEEAARRQASKPSVVHGHANPPWQQGVASVVARYREVRKTRQVVHGKHDRYGAVEHQENPSFESCFRTLRHHRQHGNVADVNETNERQRVPIHRHPRVNHPNENEDWNMSEKTENTNMGAEILPMRRTSSDLCKFVTA